MKPIKDTSKIDGTPFADILTGTDNPDFIDRLAGADTIFGYASGVSDPDGGGADDHDTIIGGDDLVQGGGGDDTIYAGSGNDSVVGGDGDDEIHGEAGNDEIDGGDGFDIVYLSGFLSDYITPSDSSNISLGRKNRYTIERIDGTQTDSVKNVEALEFEDGYSLFLDGRNNTAYAVGDALATDEETALTILASDLLANDADFEGDGFAILSVDTTGLEGTLTPTVENGVITALHYDPGAAFQSLGNGDTATTSFFYEIGDDTGGTTRAEVVITVNGIGDPAVIGGQMTGDVIEDDAATLTASGALTISDVDAGEAAFVPQAATAGSNGLGIFTLDEDGNWTWEADNSQDAIQELDAGVTATDGFDAVSIDGTSATLTVTLLGVNDAPDGTDGTVSAVEDETYAFATADFGFTDPDDAPGNALGSVIITGLPTAGALALDGSAVTEGQEVSAVDIAAGKLTFLAAPDANGAGYASLSFQVVDDGGTANGGQDTDPTPNILTIDVASVDDPLALTGAPETATVRESDYDPTGGLFTFVSPMDSPGIGLSNRQLFVVDAQTESITPVSRVSDRIRAAAAEADGKLFFAKNVSFHTEQLFSFDPATGITTQATMTTGGFASIEELVAIESKLFFRGQTDANGTELFVHDLVSGTTALVADLNTSGSSFPRDLTVLDGKLYFTAIGNNTTDGNVGLALYVHDPEVGSTELIADTYPGTATTGLYILGTFDGKLYLNANDGIDGRELFVHDPATGTTTQVADLNAGSASSDPEDFLVLDGKIYFRANFDGHGVELGVLDPVTGAAGLAADILPGAGGSFPNSFTALGGKLYFSAEQVVDDGESQGREVFVYDPETGEAALAADIVSGPGGSLPQDLTALDGKLYFLAHDQAGNRDLYVLDPNSGTTTRLSDVGTAYDNPGLQAFNGKIYFAASGEELNELGEPAGDALFVHDPVTGETAIAADLDWREAYAPDGRPILFSVVGGPSTFELDLRPLVSFGDGQAADGGFRLDPVALQDLTGLTVEGAAVKIVSDGDTLTGFVDDGTTADALDGEDKVVLTLTVSGGFAYLTLHERLDHLDGAPVTFDIGPYVTAVDTDGDTLPLGPGIATFEIAGDAPVAVDDALEGAGLGAAFTFSAADLLANDSFGTDGPGDLSIVLPETTEHGYDIVDLGDGTYQYTPMGVIPFTDSFHYNVIDANGDYDKAKATLDVDIGTPLKPELTFSVAATDVETQAGLVRDGDVIAWDGTAGAHETLFGDSRLFPVLGDTDPDLDIDAVHVFTDSGTILGLDYSPGDMLISVRETAQILDLTRPITVEPSDVVLMRGLEATKLDLSAYEIYTNRAGIASGIDGISVSPDGNLVLSWPTQFVGSYLEEFLPDGTTRTIFTAPDGFGPEGSDQGFDPDSPYVDEFDPDIDAFHLLGEDRMLFSVATNGVIDGQFITPGDIVYLDGADATILVHEEDFFAGGSGDIDALDPPMELVELWLADAGFDFGL